ncbi:hypothetical protein HPB51_015816 [Rhipicephalus microplus]|uniref:LIM zinc-binding domain-containing protein n=1 Tax=Rhipicephalus microplus TaxID=6941 RepID=A0A9J6F3Q2_RHIMP|nr:hypothetical protein HPB51_015816 [Rhipicephalus microplus]
MAGVARRHAGRPSPLLSLSWPNDHGRFGTKCAGCSLGISPTDLVRRARSKVFHLKCFTCLVCRKQLSTGEELYVLDEHRFVCKEDYLARHQPPPPQQPPPAGECTSRETQRHVNLSTIPFARISLRYALCSRCVQGKSEPEWA